MSENMKTVLPNAKFYNFSRKFWQVTAYLELGGGTGGPEISLGAAVPLASLEPPLDLGPAVLNLQFWFQS